MKLQPPTSAIQQTMGAVVPDADLLQLGRYSETTIPDVLKKFALYLESQEEKHSRISEPSLSREPIIRALLGVSGLLQRHRDATFVPAPFDLELAAATLEKHLQCHINPNDFGSLRLHYYKGLPCYVEVDPTLDIAGVQADLARLRESVPLVHGISIPFTGQASVFLQELVTRVMHTRLNRLVGILVPHRTTLSEEEMMSFEATLKDFMGSDTETLVLEGPITRGSRAGVLLKMSLPQSIRSFVALRSPCPIEVLESLRLSGDTLTRLREVTVSSSSRPTTRESLFLPQLPEVERVRLDVSGLLLEQVSQLVKPSHTPKLRALDLQFDSRQRSYDRLVSIIAERDSLRCVSLSGLGDTLPAGAVFRRFQSPIEILELPHAKLGVEDIDSLRALSSLKRLGLRYAELDSRAFDALTRVAAASALAELDARDTPANSGHIQRILRASQGVRVQVSGSNPDREWGLSGSEIQTLTDEFGERLSVF
jgi:hypothetical protein